MSNSKLYKKCLHCNADLVQTPTGRKKIYCNRQHREAFHREANLNMDRIEEVLDKVEANTDTVRLMNEPGPVFQPLPEVAIWDVRNGIPMRVV